METGVDFRIDPTRWFQMIDSGKKMMTDVTDVI